MKRVTRRFRINVEGTRMVERPFTEVKELEVFGTIIVDEWDVMTSVMDKPTQSGKIAFTLSKGTFGTKYDPDNAIPYLTDEELEIVRSAIEGYYDGFTKEEKPSIVYWTMNTAIAYQIVEEYTHDIQLGENGQLLIFDDKETAEAYVEMLDSEKNLIVNRVLLSARRF